jgi:hypothetical protein
MRPPLRSPRTDFYIGIGGDSSGNLRTRLLLVLREVELDRRFVAALHFVLGRILNVNRVAPRSHRDAAEQPVPSALQRFAQDGLRTERFPVVGQ